MSPGIYIMLAAIAISIVCDLYLFNALRRAFTNRLVQGRFFKPVYWGLAGLLVLGALIALFPLFGIGKRAAILMVFCVVLACRFCLLPFLLINDWRESIRKKKQVQTPAAARPNSEAISRSQFLAKAGLIATAAPIGALIYGTTTVYDYHIQRVKLYMPNLPKKFDGLKLGQLSDIHSGSLKDKKAVNRGLDMLLGEKPDLIFFTGDLVNHVTSEMRDWQDVFARVKAPLGVFSSMGNHDYGDYHDWNSWQEQQKNIDDMVQTHKNMGWQLLRNENRRLKVDGEEIGILGCENWGLFSQFPKYGKLDLTTRNTDDLPVKLLLSHDPTHWRQEVLPHYPNIDMMFAGHTHGMQFGVRSEYIQLSPIELMYHEWAGHYRQGAQQLYVNVGFGFLAYPGRLGILPEITIFELKASTDPALKA